MVSIVKTKACNKPMHKLNKIHTSGTTQGDNL